MEALKCKMCGSTSVTKEGEFYVCAYCGTKYPEKMKIELSGEVKVQGIDNFETMLERGDTFLKLNEYNKAKKVFEELADLYPNKCIVYLKQIIALTINFNMDNYDDYYISGLHYNDMKSAVMKLEERFLALCSIEQTIQYGADLKKIKDYIAFLDYKEEQDELKKEYKKKMEKLEEKIKKCDNNVVSINKTLNETYSMLNHNKALLVKQKENKKKNCLIDIIISLIGGTIMVLLFGHGKWEAWLSGGVLTILAIIILVAMENFSHNRDDKNVINKIAYLENEVKRYDAMLLEEKSKMDNLKEEKERLHCKLVKE